MSWQAHLLETAAIPTLGFMVVKGYAALGTSTIVAALKNVDFPEDGFPQTPIFIIRNSFDHSPFLTPLDYTILMLWVEKYAPTRLDEVLGNPSAVKEVRQWAESWKKGKKQPPLLIAGPTGSGKTSLATACAKEYGFQLLEMNTGEQRTGKIVERTAGQASLTLSLFGGLRLILFDEVDLMTSGDRGGMNAVLKIVKQDVSPIILTAENAYSPKLRDVRKQCKVVKLRRISDKTVERVLRDIAEAEDVEVVPEVIQKIAEANGGDLRAAINDLETVCRGRKKVTAKDLVLVSYRDKSKGIFDVIKAVLESQDFKIARKALSDASEDPSFLLAWIEENVPRSHQDLEDLARAFEHLSKADVYLGRVTKRQDYSNVSYALDEMAMVSLEKKHHRKRYVPYDFPQSLRIRSGIKREGYLLKSVFLKIGRKCHLSSRKSAEDYFFLLRAVPSLADYFELDEEEMNAITSV